MSYDLIARSDNSYSNKMSREQVHEEIGNLPDIKINGNSGFLLERGDDMWMEIDVSLVSEEGDCIDNNSQTATPEVNCIFFQIALTTEKPMLSCIDIALDIANAIGWELYDAQADELVIRKQSYKPWWKFW